jgi:synaptojanin
VSIVDEDVKEKITSELYERRRAEVGQRADNLIIDESEDEDLIGYDAIEPGLPPASSDRQRWWLENGKMAQSSVTRPKQSNGNSTMILNPNRPSNPFTPTDEPDWVAVPRGSRLGSFSSSISSSPYEHINHSMLLSTSASSSTPRKPLPPPFDPTTLPAKVGRMNLVEEAAGGSNHRIEAPPPPPPRRQTAVGMVETPSQSMPTMPRPIPRATTTRSPPSQPRPPSAASLASSKSKPPPPVAKKPAHLAHASPHVSPPLQGTGNAAGNSSWPAVSPAVSRSVSINTEGLSSKLTRTSSNNLMGEMHRGPSPPVTRKPVAMTPAATGPQPGLTSSGISLPGMTERKPALPARPQQQAAQLAKPPQEPTNRPSVDLLGDNVGTEMHGWEALRPS